MASHGGEISSTSSPAHRTCPACGTVVRPTQVSVRRHRGALICYALVVPLGALGYWVSWKLGLFGAHMDRTAEWPAILPMAALLVCAHRLGWVRVVRCPTCLVERCARLQRRTR